MEAKAIEKGIQWAWDIGIRDLEVQTDAKEVIKWINEHTYMRDPMREVVANIKEWQKRFQKIGFKNIFREQNLVTGRLTNMGALQDMEWSAFELPPLGLEEIVANDKMGMTTLRPYACVHHCLSALLGSPPPLLIQKAYIVDPVHKLLPYTYFSN